MIDLSFIEAKVNATRWELGWHRVQHESTHTCSADTSGTRGWHKRKDADDEGLNVISLSRRTIVKSSDTDHDAYIGYTLFLLVIVEREDGSRTTKGGPLSSRHPVYSVHVARWANGAPKRWSNGPRRDLSRRRIFISRDTRLPREYIAPHLLPRTIARYTISGWIYRPI